MLFIMDIQCFDPSQVSQGASGGVGKLVTGTTNTGGGVKLPKVDTTSIFMRNIQKADAPILTQANYVAPWGDGNPTAFDDPKGPFGSKALIIRDVHQGSGMPGVHNQQCSLGENPVHNLFTTTNQPVGPMTTTTTGGTGSSNIPQLGWDGYKQSTTFQQSNFGRDFINPNQPTPMQPQMTEVNQPGMSKGVKQGSVTKKSTITKTERKDQETKPKKNNTGGVQKSHKNWVAQGTVVGSVIGIGNKLYTNSTEIGLGVKKKLFGWCASDATNKQWTENSYKSIGTSFQTGKILLKATAGSNSLTSINHETLRILSGNG